MENKSCILVGGGYSINDGLTKGLWEKIQGKDIWSLNHAFRTLPYLPTRQVWVDIFFFNHSVILLEDMANKGVKMYAKRHQRYAALPNITQFWTSRNKTDYHGKEAFKHNLIYFGRMGLVGLFATSLAIADGYNQIYWCGFDFGTRNMNDTKTHYYQEKINVLSGGIGKPEIYLKPDNSVREEVEDFSVFLKEEDVKIYNVSINSNIPYYEKIDWETFFNKLNENS